MLLFSNPDSIALSLAHTQFLYSIRRSAAESLLTITKIQIMLIVSMAQSTRLMRQGCVRVVRGGPQRKGSKKESNPVASVVRYRLSTFSICQRILFPDQATILLYITYIDLQIARESKQVANEKKNRNDQKSSTRDPLHEITI